MIHHPLAAVATGPVTPSSFPSLYTPCTLPLTPPPRYLRCLTAIETRFPISKERGHAQISFAWFDAFQPKKRTAQANIHFEKSAVLFNMAAIVSQMALANDRATGEGLRLACQQFQVRVCGEVTSLKCGRGFG